MPKDVQQRKSSIFNRNYLFTCEASQSFASTLKSSSYLHNSTQNLAGLSVFKTFHPSCIPQHTVPIFWCYLPYIMEKLALQLKKKYIPSN